MRFSKTVACLAMAASPLAFAQDTTRNWEGEAELGYLATTGNTEETNLNGRLGFVHEVSDWRNLADFLSVYSQADDETTAERYRATAETNYKFAEYQYWFLRGNYEDDRFSGYDFQSSATTGYGNRVWQPSEDTFLQLAIGVGYRFNKLEQPDPETGSRDEDQPIARLAGRLDFELSENALFRQELSAETGLDDENTIAESVTSVQASLIGELALKLAYRVKHTTDAPPGAEKTDTETSISVLYGF